MFEKKIENEILCNLREGLKDYPKWRVEAIKYYKASDIKMIYNEAEAKLGGAGQAVLVAVSEEQRIAGQTGGTFYQVAYPVNIILAGSFLKHARNPDEERIVYELKNICKDKVFGSIIELNGVKRKLAYTAGNGITIDDKIDLYLMTGRIQAHYSIGDLSKFVYEPPFKIFDETFDETFQ